MRGIKRKEEEIEVETDWELLSLEETAEPGMVEPTEETTRVPIEERSKPMNQHSELVLPTLPLPPTMCKLMLPTVI